MHLRPSSDPNRFAQGLFDGLPDRYDVLAETLSFGQNRRWRQAMVDRIVPTAPTRVLDVATGTAGVALQLAKRTPALVTGLDLTEAMLRRGQANVAVAGMQERVELTAGRAEQLPFPDDTFDALTFTYLLRYVADPAATLHELGRVLKPGAPMASLEFLVPRHAFWRGWWWLYTRLVLPVAGALGGRHWITVGRFLGPNISRHYRRYPVPWTIQAWRDAGMTEVGVREMSLGGGLVMWGPRPVVEHDGRPAYYAASPGGLRDWWTLLHPPYTLWHLSYVVIGAALARHVDGMRLLASMLAFFAAVGVAAHALDELHDRPLRTRISDTALVAATISGILVAIGLGVAGLSRAGWMLLPFIVVGPILLLGYNLELFGGRLHTNTGFALAWGAFPLLVGYVAQTGRIDVAALVAAMGAFALSYAQRSLSTPARLLRRRVTNVEGALTLDDGTIQAIDQQTLLAPLERALRSMSWSIVAFAAALAIARLT